MLTVTETEDTMDVRRLGKKLMDNDRLFEDYMRPCEDACGYCQECQVSYETILHVLSHENCRLFKVEDDGEEVGAIYFTNNILHAHFFDGRLFGKAPAVHESIERMEMLGHGDIICIVPENSEPVGWWLKRHGFEVDDVKEDYFIYHDEALDAEVLRWLPH